VRRAATRPREQGELLTGTVGNVRRHTLISAETAVTTDRPSTAAR
jgi:hypothetical protein